MQYSISEICDVSTKRRTGPETGRSALSRYERSLMIKQVSIERTPCFGCCPVYKAMLYKSGRVVFDGWDYVSKIGRHEWQIPKERVGELFDHLTKRGYFRLNFDVCDENQITCCSSTITSVWLKDGTRKSVDHYHGNGKVPKILTTIENKIDHIIGTAEFII
jgi:hypothetical protein